MIKNIFFNIFKITKKKKILFFLILLFIFNNIYQWTPKGKEISSTKMEEKFNSQLIRKFKYIMRKNSITNLYYFLLEAEDLNNTFFQTQMLEPNALNIINKFKTYPNIKEYEYKTDFYYLFLLINKIPILSLFFILFKSLSPIIFTFYILNNFLLQSGKLKNNPLISNKQKLKFNFKDVAGNEEEKEEMKELIDFLKNPLKYSSIGASIPKGILLEGPPGTGKTLLAKALAGESGVPFYAVSGSEFVEIYIGTGASRLRKLFKEAKKNIPCVIFIDEIDILGKKRGNYISNSSSERDQTLNQLLTEMDGFTSSHGIIIIGATNRIDMLDPALLRPGRFDRKFKIGLPDVKAREAILKVHVRNKKIIPNIDFYQLAKKTSGMSGAQLEVIVNEASILTIRNKKEFITMIELEEAIDRVLMGPSKKSIKYDEEERKMVAYHESGHAVIGLKLKNAPKVQKINIIPRGSIGGYNLMIPDKETLFSSKKRMLANIISYLGGIVAEELVFDDISSGSSEDLRKANEISKFMVIKYGMSSLGVIQNTEFSDAKIIDEEIKKIINECYQEAKKIIIDNKILLNKIANLLLKKETINKEELDKLF
uniref:ATP-dependent zinc metalloprotease FtsH n=1 Tax=Phytoplasma vitis TaxID=131152 RepID=A0A2X0QAG5_PHYVT|nr:ATP-dependent zinc binding membrane protease [Candidatus Phytoplasma vitis]